METDTSLGRRIIVFHVCSLGQIQFISPIIREMRRRNLPHALYVACEYDIRGMEHGLDIPQTNFMVAEVAREMEFVDIFLQTEIYARGPEQALRIFIGHGQPNKWTAWSDADLKAFNCYFLYGELERSMFEVIMRDKPSATKHISLFDIGYPKLDDQINGCYDRTSILEQLGLDPRKKTVIYAPAWDPGGALRTYGLLIPQLLLEAGDINVITKLHPASLEPAGSPFFEFYTGGVDWRTAFSRLNENPRFAYVNTFLVNPLLVASDVMVTDFSGVALEFMTLDKPVIYQHCPEFYEKTLVEWGNDPMVSLHDERFNAGRNAGLVVEQPSMLADAVRRSIDAPHECGSLRRQLMAKFLYNPGKASSATVDKIEELLAIRDLTLNTTSRTNVESSTNSQLYNHGETKNPELFMQLPQKELPFVSIIIPSYNRAHLVGTTIESFVNQEYPPSKFEIIIADNNSPDNTREIVDEWRQKSRIAIRYLHEPRQGVHYARNSAAKVARGEILYFTDDDMIADKALLSEIVKVFEADSKVGSATGRVLPCWEVQPPEWLLRLCYNYLLSINDQGDGFTIAEHDLGVFSCHQAMTREAFFAAGGFNPESTETEYIGDGETGLNIKIKELGYKFAYNGKSIIHHIIPKGRMTQDYLNKRLANQGSADSYTDFRRERYDDNQLVAKIASHRDKIVYHLLTATLKKMENDIEWRLDEARAHYYLSRINYDLRILKDEQWKSLVLRYDWIND